MKTSCQILILIAILFQSCQSHKQTAKNNVNERPNVILIITDDMGYSDIGCYGGEIQTPALDQLASSGIKFSQFYNGGKCEPSRAIITTGHYYHTTRNQLWKDNLPSFGDVMSQAGYRTMMVGKWHAKGKPWERGFHRTFGHMSGATDFYVGDKSFQLDGNTWEVPKTGFYNTDANTDFAIKFIKEEKGKHPDKPFFMYLGYNAPHSPIQAPREDVEKYIGKYRKGWDATRKERFERQKQMGLMKEGWKITPRPENIHAWNLLSDKEKDFEDLRMATYAAMIDRVDQGIAKIIRQLEEMNIRDNTLIMFVNDNGGSPYDRVRGGGRPFNSPGSHWNVGLGWANCSNTPFKYYKRTQHNGGNMTPFIASWPGVIDARKGYFDESSHLMDIMPTLIDVARTEYPTTFKGLKTPELPGKSLVPFFKNEKRALHDTLYFSLFRNHAVLLDNWKLVTAYDQPWALYDLDADRTETTDLFSENPEKAKELLTVWNNLKARQGKFIDNRAQGEAEPKRAFVYDDGGNLLPPQKELKAVPLAQ